MQSPATNLLSEEAFSQTFVAPMRNVTNEVTNVLDIWPYVSSIPQSDLNDHLPSDGIIDSVYRDASSRFDQVLVVTNTPNIFLVVVVDLDRDSIHGHHLLDLNQKYGLENQADA